MQRRQRVAEQSSAQEKRSRQAKTANTYTPRCRSGRLMVKLVNTDGQQFYIDFKVAQKFGLIKGFQNLTELVNSRPMTELADISSETIAKFMEWVEHHKDDTPHQVTEHNGNRVFELKPWDREFYRLSYETLLQLIRVAILFQIEDLRIGACIAISLQQSEK